MATAPLTYQVLSEAMRNGAAAIRARTRLQPAGGPGDKVFPPTFGDTTRISIGERDHTTKYAVEERRIDGESLLCVLLDSVASQANRMEEALQRSWDEGCIKFPMVRVDFTDATDDDPALDLSTIGGDGYLTALEAPHRLADALLRDSMLGEMRFRASEHGQAFTESTPHRATPVYALCPTALIFGMWDSTGPKGGQGSKFQRALVSEVTGVGVAFGRKTASRIDPAGVELNAGLVYQAADADEEWTLSEDEAQKDSKGKPILFSRKGNDKAGKPSSINHGNIMPAVDSDAGGVTLDYAEQVTVLSLPALRRLRFPQDVNRKQVARAKLASAEGSARAALAALALAAVALQRDNGFDFRSRCIFVPDGPLHLEIVDRDGKASTPYTLSSDDAFTLVTQASDAAADQGMGWSAEPIDLVPAPKLVELIRNSRRAAARGDEEQDA